MKVAIVGGGIAGLTCAYLLAERGVDVTVYESDTVPGGLAASFDHEGVWVERYYHFICRPDGPYFRLLGELGLMDQLVWHPTKMGYFVDGRYFRFGTPFSLLAFSPLNIVNRIRFGLAALRSKRARSWRDLDSKSAREWLTDEQGRQAYEVVWKPLLELKFGDRAGDVSAAWMWARINRVASSREGVLMREYLGHLIGGTKTLIDELDRRITQRNGTIRLATRVERIEIEDGRVIGIVAEGTSEACDAVISTVAPPILLEIAPDLPDEMSNALARIDYYGVACWLLVAREPLSDDFWLNIHDPEVPYPGVITYTNLNPMPELGGRHILYVPMYMSTKDPRWPRDEQTQLPGLLTALDRIKPGFSDGVEKAFLFRDPYAQPVFDTGFGERFEDLMGPTTPVQGLYRTDMSQIYPDDRSLVNAIDKAYGIVEALFEDLGVGGTAR